MGSETFYLKSSTPEYKAPVQDGTGGGSSHPSTNQARPCLASEIRRDRARSGWCGRRLEEDAELASSHEHTKSKTPD